MAVGGELDAVTNSWYNNFDNFRVKLTIDYIFF
jgi:hypothetical protein